LTQLTPASAIIDPLYHDSLFYLSISDTQIPQSVAAPDPTHIQSHPDGSTSPHPFYKKMLQWNKMAIEMAEQSLVDAITTHNLHICADGAFLKEHGQGSHAWVFSDGSHQELWKGAGPTFGHTDLMTPYRAELSGLTSVLFILQWVCSRNAIGDGKVMIYCDNEAALNETFAFRRPTNNPYQWLAADIDLIATSRDLLLQLPITVKICPKWVKGHYKGKKEISHKLNDAADKLARDFNSTIRPQAKSPPPIPPMFEVELLHQNQVITSRLGQVISTALHEAKLGAYIRNKASWSEDTFNRVNWVAHKQAFTSYKRVPQLSICKLVHGLYHTNREANKLYGTTDKCPCCESHIETLQHVFWCQEEHCRNHRHEARDKLKTTLTSCKTPQKLLAMILHGIEEWESIESANDKPVPLYRGSVLPEDILLIQAFQEQTAIGWDQLLRGRISLKWNSAYRCLVGGKRQVEVSPDPWAKTLIRGLWDYAASLWKYRNGVVHGKTKEDGIKKEFEQLHKSVQAEYAAYAQDKFIISPQFSSLFTKKTLQERIKMDRDSLSCWLRSVAAAKVHQETFRKSLGNITNFFKRHQKVNDNIKQPIHNRPMTANMDRKNANDSSLRCNIPLCRDSVPLPSSEWGDIIDTSELDPG
jgi:ribonuclease HI